MKANKIRGGGQQNSRIDNIKKWIEMDFASTARTAEDRTRKKKDCSKIICGAPATLRCYWID